jgi:hypothetical protein
MDNLGCTGVTRTSANEQYSGVASYSIYALLGCRGKGNSVGPWNVHLNSHKISGLPSRMHTFISGPISTYLPYSACWPEARNAKVARYPVFDNMPLIFFSVRDVATGVNLSRVLTTGLSSGGQSIFQCNCTAWSPYTSIQPFNYSSLLSLESRIAWYWFAGKSRE